MNCTESGAKAFTKEIRGLGEQTSETQFAALMRSCEPQCFNQTFPILGNRRELPAHPLTKKDCPMAAALLPDSRCMD